MKRLLGIYLVQLLTAAAVAQGGIFVEIEDAGGPDRPLSTNPSGGGPLGEILGAIGGTDIVDAFCIAVDDPVTFYATTNPNDDPRASVNFDARLYLFDLHGNPLFGNDDSPSAGNGAFISNPTTFPGNVLSAPPEVVSGSWYILAITPFPLEPQDVGDLALIELQGDFEALHGPNLAAGAYHHWSPAAVNNGLYTIALQGASACGSAQVFATSTQGTGDLSTWAGAGGLTGLAAADAVCIERAIAANLPDPTRFVAWLSDAQDDAYCRAFGLGGKKSTGCGVGSLPTGIGPFVLTDGTPFAPTIEELTGNRVVWHPVRRDEFGTLLVSQVYFTATTGAGELNGTDTCGNWTNGSTGNARSGSTEGATSSWTNAVTAACSNSQRLLCVQSGRSAPPVRIPQGRGRIAFKTSATGTGVLSTWSQAGGLTGLAAGDNICQTMATNASLPEPQSFKAWLSTSTVDAKDRLTRDGSWYRADGVLFAKDKAQLISSSLETALSVDETGNFAVVTTVWTGTTGSGTAASNACGDWTSPSDFGSLGAASFADQFWGGSAGSTVCGNASNSIYCFSDARATLFADGFETGDTSAWDNTVACGASCP